MPRPELSRRITEILAVLEAGGREPGDLAGLVEEFDTLACRVVAEYAVLADEPKACPAARNLN